MNLAISRKVARDSLILLIVCLCGISALEMLFVGALNEFIGDIAELWLHRSFFQRFARLLVGAEIGPGFTFTGMMTIGFAHPMLLTMLWAFVLTTCSRVLVGEIERGTADLVLTLPVRRSSYYASVSATWMLAGVPLVLAAWFGMFVARSLIPLKEPLDVAALARLLPNLYGVYFCTGCVTMMISGWVSRRGQAIAITLGWLLGSMLLSFLGQFWSVLEQLGAAGVMHYYKPLVALERGTWISADVITLLAAGLFFWLVGLVSFCRRDIPAA
jgi:putative exporter of polyketide antibiotics